MTQKIRLDSIEFHKAYFSSHTFLLEVLEKSRLLGNNTDLSIEIQSLILIKLQIKLPYFRFYKTVLYLFLRPFGHSSTPKTRFFSSIFRAFGASSIQGGLIIAEIR